MEAVVDFLPRALTPTPISPRRAMSPIYMNSFNSSNTRVATAPIPVPQVIRRPTVPVTPFVSPVTPPDRFSQRSVSPPRFTVDRRVPPTTSKAVGTLSRHELLQMAAERGIYVPGYTTKDGIIRLLEEYEENQGRILNYRTAPRVMVPAAPRVIVPLHRYTDDRRFDTRGKSVGTLSRRELLDMADERGILASNYMTKDEIVQLLEDYEENQGRVLNVRMPAPRVIVPPPAVFNVQSTRVGQPIRAIPTLPISSMQTVRPISPRRVAPISPVRPVNEVRPLSPFTRSSLTTPPASPPRRVISPQQIVPVRPISPVRPVTSVNRFLPASPPRSTMVVRPLSPRTNPVSPNISTAGVRPSGVRPITSSSLPQSPPDSPRRVQWTSSANMRF